MRQMALKDLLELSDAGVWGDEDPKKGISVLRSTNFRSDGRIDFNNLSFRRVDEPKRSQKSLTDGDILLEKSGGGPKQPVGRVCLFRGHEMPHAFGNFLSRLRPRREIIDPQYLFYRLWQFHAVGLTTSYQKQTSGIRNLETKRYLELPIALPPLPEQRRIVELLSRAENIVRMRKEAEAKTKDIIPALFLDMFGDPGRNPKGLNKRPLGDLLKVKSGEFLPAEKMDSQGTIPVFGGNGINGYHSTAIFEEPMVVIGRVGAYCGNVHKTPAKSWITDNALYVAERYAPLREDYLVHALRNARLNRVASQAGQPLISGGRIYPVEILVPSEEHQDTFINLAVQSEGMVGQQRQATERAEHVFQSLLAGVFGGEE